MGRIISKRKRMLTLTEKKLGNTNLQLSLIGLGTVKFGRNTQVKYPREFLLPNKQEIIKLISLAKDLGINTLDTAPSYGDAEQKLGQLFNDKNNNISRNDWVVITKAGESFVNEKSHYDFSAKYISNSIDNSLRNLHTDFIDILLIHSDGSDEQIAANQELWQILEYRKSQGDIRAYGVSSKTQTGGLECLKRSDLAMVTYRADYLDEKPLIDYAAANNKGIILKKVLNSGHHSAKESIQFASCEPAVNSMILGTINPNHLEENVNYLISTAIL
jgi:aryl-alcohol dehydrogenase-like predicted oxidoreductase